MIMIPATQYPYFIEMSDIHNIDGDKEISCDVVQVGSKSDMLGLYLHSIDKKTLENPDQMLFDKDLEIIQKAKKTLSENNDFDESLMMELHDIGRRLVQKEKKTDD